MDDRLVDSKDEPRSGTLGGGGGRLDMTDINLIIYRLQVWTLSWTSCLFHLQLVIQGKRLSLRKDETTTTTTSDMVTHIEWFATMQSFASYVHISGYPFSKPTFL